jgi:hypothetical protein
MITNATDADIVEIRQTIQCLKLECMIELVFYSDLFKYSIRF